MPLRRVVEIGRQVARALAAAHAAGIVHRDIKPENIMLRPDGFVKVLDFGLARATDASAASPERLTTHLATAPGVLIGTPAYMAPEQASGRSIGPAVDVFALGVVLYEMATGRRPFNGATPLAVLASIISVAAAAARRTLNPAVPRAFDDLRAPDAGRRTRRAGPRRATSSASSSRVGRRDDCWASLVAAAAAPRATVGRDRPARRNCCARLRARQGGTRR